MFQNGGSGGDSSDSCSEGEMNENDPESLSVFVTPDHEMFSSISPPSSPPESKHSKTSSNSTGLNPLLYSTPQGMMYATASNGGMLLSLAQTDPNSTQPFITIPISMVSSNGQGSDLEITKRK